MNLIILSIVGFIAVAFLVDAFRQSSKRNAKRENDIPARILSADESGPTETGRFRVQQVLGGAGNPRSSSGGPPTPTAAPGSVPEHAEDEAPLPDPFDGGSEGGKRGTE